MEPIFDRLVESYAHSVEITGLAAALWLDDWYHERGLLMLSERG